MLDELISYPSVCSLSGAKCLPGALSSVCRTGTQKHSPELLTPFSSESTGGHRCPVMFRPEVTHEQIVHQTQEDGYHKTGRSQVVSPEDTPKTFVQFLPAIFCSGYIPPAGRTWTTFRSWWPPFLFFSLEVRFFFPIACGFLSFFFLFSLWVYSHVSSLTWMLFA